MITTTEIKNAFNLKYTLFYVGIAYCLKPSRFFLVVMTNCLLWSRTSALPVASCCSDLSWAIEFLSLWVR